MTLLKFFSLSVYFIRTCFFLLIFLDFYLLSLLYNTQTTNFHARGGIRISNPSKRATTTLALDRSTARIGRFDPGAKQTQVKRMTALVIVFVVYVLFSASSDTCLSVMLHSVPIGMLLLVKPHVRLSVRPISHSMFVGNRDKIYASEQ